MQVWTNSNRNGEVDTLDYHIIEKDDKLVVTNANPEYYKDDQMGSLYDDGDGVYINIIGKSIRLDYQEVVVMLALLMASHEDKIELRVSKTIKSI